MSEIKYVTGVKPNEFGADDLPSELQGTRDGAIWTADWVMARCHEGRVFSACAGTVTTPISFGAGDIAETEQDLLIYVPSGTSIGILSVQVQMETFGTGAIFECMGKIGTYTTAQASTAGTAITLRSLRSDAPLTSNCTALCALTAVASTGLTGAEFWRDGREVAETLTTAGQSHIDHPHKYSWDYVKDGGGIIPTVVGAGACAIYAAAQAGTGFIKVIYVEIPTTRI
jgi:hypothetical protein